MLQGSQNQALLSFFDGGAHCEADSAVVIGSGYGRWSGSAWNRGGKDGGGYRGGTRLQKRRQMLQLNGALSGQNHGSLQDVP